MKKLTSILFTILVTSVAIFAFTSNASADEGMWTLNGFPTKTVAQKYGFTATPSWLEHVQLSSARLAKGCSGSFVSANGLVMTNHHCAHSCIEQLSKPGKDFVATGFYAQKPSDEVRCSEIEVNRLTHISDVTARVNLATKGLVGAPYNDVLKATMSAIEKECSAGSADVRCDVVSLYHGGLYQLYSYKRYQDVRLVFAPELSIAFFGGDPDNFMFPRYDLDVAFLRVYDGGRPLTEGDHFQWSTVNAKDGDLTFVTGNPGRTSRLQTVSELEFSRDVSLPRSLILQSELRGLLTEFGNRGAEEKRIADPQLFGVENSVKAQKGRFEALLDTDFMNKKKAEEKTLRQKVEHNPKLKKAYGSAWKETADAVVAFRDLYPAYTQLEANRAWGSKLFAIARNLVRTSAELTKPNGERLREYADSNMPAIKQDIFTQAPIHDELEIEMLTFGLTKLRENLRADNPAVQRILGKHSPRQIAEEIVKKTKLHDVKERGRLFTGGASAIAASTDPLVLFAKLVDQEARPVRKTYEDKIESVFKLAGEKIAKAKFAAEGTKSYPDATFTLRISYGQIEGYKEDGKVVKPITNMAGAFTRATGADPFALPQTWLKAKDALDLNTPFDFCSTNDIIGGNSGSPVINRNAEVVGLIFDGNIQSLGGEFGFDASVNRAVAVHSAALIEALKKVYHADRVVKDLTGKDDFGPQAFR